MPWFKRLKRFEAMVTGHLEPLAYKEMYSEVPEYQRLSDFLEEKWTGARFPDTIYLDWKTDGSAYSQFSKY
jgi:hypothetical protein